MFKGNLSGKVKGMKKNGMPNTGPLTKVKILGDNVKVSELFSSSSFFFLIERQMSLLIFDYLVFSADVADHSF